MTILPARVAGVVLAAAAVAGVAALSRASYRAHPGEDGAIRIAWSARPERLETCVEHSDEELAARPAHMRQRLECEGAAASYRLRVLRDGILLADEVVTGGGIRQDRPIHLLRHFPAQPGPQVIDVTFVRTADVDATGEEMRNRAPDSTAGALPDREHRERDERRRRREEAVPARLELRDTVDLQPREVMLVTYEPQARRLVIVRGRAP